MNKVLEDFKALYESRNAVLEKVKDLVESNMAMKEELSRVQENLENMSEEEFQLLEGTSEKFQVVESTKTIHARVLLRFRFRFTAQLKLQYFLATSKAQMNL